MVALLALCEGNPLVTGWFPWEGTVMWNAFPFGDVTITRIIHYNNVIMGVMASQITGLTIVYPIVYSGTVERIHQSSASLAFMRRIHRWPVNFPHKGLVTQKMFPFDYVIIYYTTLLYQPYFYQHASSMPKQSKMSVMCCVFANPYKPWHYFMIMTKLIT